MKKILVTIGIISMVITGAGAVSVCAKDSIVTFVLDPTINGSEGTYNNALATWKVSFPYGTISGISTCISNNPGTTGTVFKTDGTYLESLGGEAAGFYCWCKMTHPMVSLWAFARYGYSGCASNCASYCEQSILGSTALRAGLFGSVATANAMY